MKKDYPRFTLRVPEELLFKLSHIAEFNGRTKNREIEQTLKQRVSDFEKKYGPIPVPDHIDDEE